MSSHSSALAVAVVACWGRTTAVEEVDVSECMKLVGEVAERWVDSRKDILGVEKKSVRPSQRSKWYDANVIGDCRQSLTPFLRPLESAKHRPWWRKASLSNDCGSYGGSTAAPVEEKKAPPNEVHQKKRDGDAKSGRGSLGRSFQNRPIGDSDSSTSASSESDKSQRNVEV